MGMRQLGGTTWWLMTDRSIIKERERVVIIIERLFWIVKRNVREKQGEEPSPPSEPGRTACPLPKGEGKRCHVRLPSPFGRRVGDEGEPMDHAYNSTVRKALKG